MSKTNAIRILEAKGIKHRTFEYIFNEDELDAVTVAHKVDAEPESVFKTLVAHGDKTGTVVFCIPGNAELDLKKAAAVSDNKSVEMAKTKDLLALTGYIRGGCSPIGMKKKFPTYIEESAQLFDEIYVSAGMRGMQVKLPVKDLAGLTEASFYDLIK
jgi:Cys-tRNA(Pro)/Cys-tRNA(Cys) deacylase